MVDEDARRCIADLCSVLEVTIKLLLEIGPSAAALPTTLSQKWDGPFFAVNHQSNTEDASRLGGFVALRD
ncbi:MAG TPA: hypothetical protein VG860_06865, partial [Terriglobia bacterium]|nr:hypothetical protein [Terriglobia bacterium]